jgi:3-oxoacyl-[acyl-carrier-protein] synthase II
MLKKHRVVITGSGVASPTGNNVETYCHNLYQGRYAIGPITTFDTTKTSTKLAACLNPIPAPTNFTPLQAKMSSQLSLLAAFCVEQAVGQAGLDFSKEDSNQAGVIVGSGFQNLYDLENFYQKFYQFNERPAPSTIPLNMGNAPASRIAMTYNLTGMVGGVTTACSSGFTAISDSYRLIRDGYQQVMIAGGCDLTVCATIVNAWERMRVLSKEKKNPALACRPFDQNRSGVVLGDGAAFFVLECYDHAVRRGAPILAEISSVFQNSDSLDLVKPDSTFESRCIEQTIRRAGLAPADIDMIYAHATSTRLNDTTEYQSLQLVFGEQLPNIPICALKSMLGHTMGASGPMALVAALKSLKSGYFYPIPNLETLEDGMDLLITTTGKILAPSNHILINTFAFGGINVGMIISALGDTP